MALRIKEKKRKKNASWHVRGVSPCHCKSGVLSRLPVVLFLFLLFFSVCVCVFFKFQIQKEAGNYEKRSDHDSKNHEV